MNDREIIALFERIKRHFNNFGYDSDKVSEWKRFLKDYDKREVENNLDKFITEGHDRPPLIFELTRNLFKTTAPETKPYYIQCEYCGEKILTEDDWGVYELHHRRCQKIDFINRQRKEIEGKEIDYAKYRAMSDEELNKRYRRIMDNWVETHPDIAITPDTLENVNNLFKKMDGEENE